jgi:hypothetical protein
MLRTYAFSGKKKWVLAVLLITLLGLLGVTIWVMSKELSRLSRRPSLSRHIPDIQRNCSDPLVCSGQPHRLFRPFRPTDCQFNRVHFSTGSH